MANSWDEFFAAPIKASKKLHVTAKDVKRGAQIDARRREAELAIQKQSPTYPSRANAAKLDPGARGRDAMFWSAVDATSPAPELSELPSRGAQLARTALSGAGSFGGWADPMIEEPTPDMLARMAGQAVSDPLNAVGLGALKYAGQIAKKVLPAAVVGASTGYAADAEAMPFHSLMKRLGAHGMPEKTSLYINPDRSELMRMLKDARETYPTDPTVRLLRDRRNTDIYGVEGSSILHDDMRKHLGMSYERAPGTQGNTLPALEAEMDFLKQMAPGKFAGGGLVKSGLKMMFPNLAAPMHVVKPKGGNWLNGSVEDALKGLKTEMRPPVPGAVRGPIEPYNNGVSERVRWLSPEGHTIEVQEGPAGHFGRQDSMDSWIEGPLTKYVKTRMASPDDEVRRLADQGILHVDQDSLRNSLRTPGMVSKARIDAGFPEGGMSPLKPGERTAGYDWENASDSFIISGRAGSYANTNTFGGKNPGPTYLRDNPWLATVPPETPVYDFATRSTGSPQLAPSLGFDHLIDELSNALDPNSGLPRHLALTPEAVKNLSMEKAVRRVADINAWRAAQIAEANGKIAGGPGQELVREYPHTPATPNPKGLRWVELKKQTGDSLSDAQLVKAMEERGMYPEEIEAALKDPAQRAQIEEQAFSDVGALADQLKYEGATMGHCVGGYCDDVISGRSRIFSLRDAKGEPHVTIETGSGYQDPRFEAPEEMTNKWAAQAHAEAESLGIPDDGDEYMDFVSAKESELAEAWAATQKNKVRIVQIKGKQNRKPNDEYLPFVQDFVKNPPHGQPWDEVGDLQNSGLKDLAQFGNEPLIQEALKKQRYMSQEEWDAMMKAPDAPYIPDAHKYASGGSVGVPAAGWELLTDPTGSPTENKLSWDIFSGHNDAEQLEAQV